MITTTYYRNILPDNLKAIEERIDNALLRAASFGHRYARVQVDAPLRASLDFITRRYEDGGWKVTYYADGRDGDFVEFMLP